MRGNRRCVVLTLLLLLAALCVPLSVVEVSTGGSVTGRRILVRETAVSLSYTHSVERTPVVEFYEASPSGLRLSAVRWKSFGAGMPENYDDFEDGFYVRHVDVALGRRLDYWFLPENQASVSVESGVLFAGPGVPSLVTIRVRLVPLLMAVA